MPRKIIHVDMDAFYASVEQRDDPALRGLPVAVGGSKARGVVAAASYEARRFGVRSAMPSVTARRKCPDLVFVKPRFEVYRTVSEQIRAVFHRYTDLVEPLSLDEAYLDVTENHAGIAIATEIARRIKAEIKRETGLNASAGVSYNKFLAKLASDYDKPDGLYVITPRTGPAFIERLEIGRFHGVGPATEAKMHRLGIRTGGDLKAKSLDFLNANFRSSGPYYYGIARGRDERPVRPNRIRKSIGAERTFSADLTELAEAHEALAPIIEKVAERCEANDRRGRTVTLKVKYADFEQITRRETLPCPVGDAAAITASVTRLLEPLFPTRKGIRLLGATVSGFAPTAAAEEDAEQLDLLALVG